MEIGKKMQDALSGQVNQELYAAYLYYSAAGYFESAGLKGFAKWMGHHAEEELAHAKKIHGFVLTRGGQVKLEAIKAPKSGWGSPIEAIQDAYEHECKVTKMIDDLVDLAREEGDKATEVFLHWFVTEQVEEEEITSDLLQKLKLMGDSKGPLLALDAALLK